MTAQPQLSVDGFSTFFRAIHQRDPFRWQIRLAEKACRGDWQDYIKLPTASGKTSCIDIAVFALAYQAYRRNIDESVIDAPRRIFFVVDRRIIVNEAFNRGYKIRTLLEEAVALPDNPLFPVAWWLRSLTGNPEAPPLDCFELRGGIYRDDAWVRSMLQPTIVTSTVDQVGSRLLFRGYGVTDCNLPIHAALTANDSMILLDEAHCSKPFSQTMKAIAEYRDAFLRADEVPRWAQQAIRTPFRFIEMTATPNDVDPSSIFQLDDADYAADHELEVRHGCAKPICLEESSAKGANQNSQLAKDLVSHASALARGSDSVAPCFRIAIVVNRVSCARQTFELLKKEYGDHVELMIGRMRPIDRDKLTTKLQAQFQSNSQAKLEAPHFVVATQCLEVGADFDFDGMVCQCASLDALRQRFGRLNRLGHSPHARGMIVMAEGDKSPKKPDPIYDVALPATWEWMKRRAPRNVMDFGIKSLDKLLASARSENVDEVDRLSAPATDAPVLMPALLDLLCQTAPRPAVEPNIAAYLHGPDRDSPEVRICWRADLPKDSVDSDSNSWLELCRQTLAVCPPSVPECLSVPLSQFRDWLRGQDGDKADDTGDVLGETDTGDGEIGNHKLNSRQIPQHRRGVVWNGHECKPLSALAKEIDALRPNVLVVLPASAGGWTQLGYIPDAPAEPNTQHVYGNDSYDLAKIDQATFSYWRARKRYILRVHPALVTDSADQAALADLQNFIDDNNKAWQHGALRLSDEQIAGLSVLSDDTTDSLEERRSIYTLRVRKLLFDAGPKRAQMVRYPGGFVVTGPPPQKREIPRASFDDDFDEHNIDAGERVSLIDHLADVTSETKRLVSKMGLDASLANALVAAAERHDLGKADPRFQAMLLGSSIDMAWMQPKLWAKSARGPVSQRMTLRSSEAKRPSDPDQLPLGFRHEMLSVMLAQELRHELDDGAFELMQHTIAAHHGHARPMAPVAVDAAPPSISLDKLFSPQSASLRDILSTDERLFGQQHRLDSKISERFWTLNKRYGWWGLAWLESALRLADWAASAQPNRNIPTISFQRMNAVRTDNLPTCQLSLPGLSATNLLGFLAALGLFRTVSRALPNDSIKLKWQAAGTWHPVLLSHREISREELNSILHEELRERQNDDHFVKLGKNTNVSRADFQRCIRDVAGKSDQNHRTSLDFLAAFGSDALVSINDGITIQDTALRTMAGAGHQHFLETMQNLIKYCSPEHLDKTIFRTWDYSDPTQTLSLRFDPLDDNRYALRWRNPSGDPERKTSGSMVGANRLAIEAIPLLATAPGEKRLQTTGFSGSRSDDTFFHWPIWHVPLGLSVVQSLLTSRDIVSPLSSPDSLIARGVSAVMRSQRITVGKVRNFSPANAVWARTDRSERELIYRNVAD